MLPPNMMSVKLWATVVNRNAPDIHVGTLTAPHTQNTSDKRERRSILAESSRNPVISQSAF